MKKIKISELPLYNSLKGLFTIGTDKDNRSVKVSLEFVEDAAKDATDAASAAQTAKTNAETATRNASTATNAANTAAGNANTAASAANTAKANADTATRNANTAASNANMAASAANTSKSNADKATAAAKEATENANEAAAEASAEAATARETIMQAFSKLVPNGLEVEAVEVITLGNTFQNRIKTALTPTGTMHNVMFISDNKAVRIAPDGRIMVVGRGTSEVQVIPTCNTALAQTILIRVEAPTLRILNARNKLRFMANGAIRLN